MNAGQLTSCRYAYVFPNSWVFKPVPPLVDDVEPTDDSMIYSCDRKGRAGCEVYSSDSKTAASMNEKVDTQSVMTRTPCSRRTLL